MERVILQHGREPDDVGVDADRALPEPTTDDPSDLQLVSQPAEQHGRQIIKLLGGDQRCSSRNDVRRADLDRTLSGATADHPLNQKLSLLAKEERGRQIRGLSY